MFVAVVFYILLIIEGEVWNVKAEMKAMNLRTGITVGVLEYTDGILRHKVDSLLPVRRPSQKCLVSVILIEKYGSVGRSAT